MNWPGIDYHNHICGTNLDAMVASARARGVREFGISEHIFMLDEGQSIFPGLEEEGRRMSRAAYVETVRGSESSSDGFVLRLGLEVDYVPGTEEAVADVLSGVEWDFILGSVHEIDGVDLFEFAPSTADEGVRLWRRYYELITEAIESGAFDIITHPVRNAELNPHLPPDFDRILAEVASFARLHGVALELNGYDTVTWPQLVEQLAAACGRTQCPVSLGADAHAPFEVTQGMPAAFQFARSAGVTNMVTFNRRDRRLVPVS